MTRLLYTPLIFFIILGATSCSVSKYVAPPFTDIDKILELQPGQTVKEVSETLKIKPYDVVYSHDKGKMILIYNYRVKDRKMPLPTRTAEQTMHSESAQRQGELWYNNNYRELYILFQDDKLKGIYGEEVLAVGAQVETMDAYLDGEGGIADASGKKTSANEDLLFASSVYKERYDRKSAQLDEDKQAKQRRNMLLGGSAFTILLLIGIITR